MSFLTIIQRHIHYGMSMEAILATWIKASFFICRKEVKDVSSRDPNITPMMYKIDPGKLKLNPAKKIVTMLEMLKDYMAKKRHSFLVTGTKKNMVKNNQRKDYL